MKVKDILHCSSIPLKFVNDEHDARVSHELSLRDDVEERWQDLQKTQEDQLRTMKDMQKVE